MVKLLCKTQLGYEIIKTNKLFEKVFNVIYHLEYSYKIVDLLDNPTTCPFGHPNPGSSYEPKDGLLTLNEVKVESSYTVDRLPEDDRELLEYFVGNEFLPGANFSVTDCSIPRGIITLSCGERELVFSLALSTLIWVY